MTLEKPANKPLPARTRLAAWILTGPPGRAYSFTIDLSATFLALGAYAVQRAAGIVTGRQRRSR